MNTLGRRAVLGGATAALAASTIAMTESTAHASSDVRRIDLHTHHIPDVYRTSLEQHGDETLVPDWSPALAVDFMDRYDIEAQVVSVSTPACTHLADRADRVALAREVNDWTAALVHSDDPATHGRFGAFALLPLGIDPDAADVAAACAEAERAVRELGLDGIGLLSSYGDTYLGDVVLDPLLATIERLDVLAMVHPATPATMPAVGRPALPALVLEFTFDTTRAAVNMSYRGTYLKFPRLRLQLSHSGGTLPFVAWRATVLSYAVPTPEESFDYGRLYYDTALSWGPDAQVATKRLAGSRHVVLGTDWPYTDAIWEADGDKAAELSRTWSGRELDRVMRDNALDLLPTLRARLRA